MLIGNNCEAAQETQFDGARTDAHVASMKARTAVPNAYFIRTIHDVLSLPSCPSACGPDLQPNCGGVCWKEVDRFAPLENQAVKLTGELCYVNDENDGDLHLELGEPGDDCPLMLNPFRLLVVEVTPPFRAKSPAWKALLTESKWTERNFHPEAITSPAQQLSRQHATGIIIRVGGLLMRDTHSEGARSGWEIHPVTRIECQFSPGNWSEFTNISQCIRPQ
jgi:hypothetical protein